MSIIAPGDAVSAASAGAASIPRSATSSLGSPAPPDRAPSPSIKEEIDEALAGFKAEVLLALVQGIGGLRAEGPPTGRSNAGGAPGPSTYGPSLNQPHFNAPPTQYNSSATGFGGPPPGMCFYCYRNNCHSWTCPFVAEDVQAGYIQRHSATRRILLPGGGEPPPGPGPMRDRVLRWHTEHPGQRAVAQLQAGVAGPTNAAVGPGPGGQAPGPTSGSGGQVHSMLLSVEANLQDADNELTQEESEYAAQLALDLVRGRRRKEKFAGVFLPPPPGKKGKPRAVSQARSAEDVADAESTATTGGTSEGSERGEDLVEAPAQAANGTESNGLPYATVPDGSAAGAPKVRDFAYKGGVASKEVQTEKPPTSSPKVSTSATRREPAYKHLAGAHDPQALDKVFERNFGATPTIHITTAELINISDAARKRLHAMTALARHTVTAPVVRADNGLSVAETVTALVNAALATDQSAPEPPRCPAAYIEEVPDEDALEVPGEAGVETYKVDALPIELRADGDAEPSDEEDAEPEGVEDGGPIPPAPGVYRLDPHTFPGGTRAHAPLAVGRATHKLRSIWAVIADAAAPTECVLDPGSQIVAISERKCIELGIAWDNQSRMRMVSANNTANETAGLAQDVPLEIAPGIVVYLQLHVIGQASYDVLLGRPFDVLMATEVVNSTNGDQLITVTCPNTKLSRTIPTFARGNPPAKRPVGQVFRRSMN